MGVGRIIGTNGSRRREMMTLKPKYDGKTFGGLMLAPGPLIYENGEFAISTSWDASSYSISHGKVEGSTYFTFLELGERFDSRGESFVISSGDIDNNNKMSFGGYNDWRIMALNELGSIMSTSTGDRLGSTVNGNNNKHFSAIVVSTPYARQSYARGLLFYPDGEVITGVTLRYYDRVTTTTISLDNLNDYLEQGCIFMPYCGRYYNGFSNINTDARYFTVTTYVDDSLQAYNSYWTNSQLAASISGKDNCSLCAWPVRTIRHRNPGELIYQLSNYTCNGTQSTAINTELRLFNTTDFPNGFTIEFSCTVTLVPISNEFGTWFACTNETGSPWPGIMFRQERNNNSQLRFGVNTNQSNSVINSGVTASVGTTVDATISYDGISALTMTLNNATYTYNGTITHNFTLTIGGNMNAQGAWYSDRYGYVQIDSFKVYRL